MDDGKLPYDPAMAGLDSHRAKGPVSMRRRGEEGKARCKRGEVPGNCCGAALLIPTIHNYTTTTTTTTTHEPLSRSSVLHLDSGTGIVPEAEARVRTCGRVRVTVR